MSKSRKRRVAVLVLLCSVLLSCDKKPADPNDPKSGPAEPTPLFRHAMSYWNFEKTKRELGYSNFQILEDRRPLVSDKRPPFHLVRIKVAEFADNGYNGDLVLWFFNDRLMRTQFYVSEVKGYVSLAAGSQGFTLNSEQTGEMPPHTRVWVGKEADGRSYLGMEDEVLKQQMNDWITHYSVS